MDCPICAEKCNKIRREVTCTCGFKACSKCIKNYILTSINYPSCMECKCEWTDDFIIKNLTYAFYSKDMANKVKALIIEEEKALIPNDIPEAERRKKIEIRSKKMDKYHIRCHIAWNAYCSVINNLENSKVGLFRTRLYTIINNDPEIITTFYKYDRLLIDCDNKHVVCNELLKDVIKDVKLKISLWRKIVNWIKEDKIIIECRHFMDDNYFLKLDRMLEELEEYYVQYYSDTLKLNNIRNMGSYTNDGPSTRKEFIMKCSKVGCNSLISNKYKCPMCDTYTCKDCHINLKDLDEKKSHVCDEDLAKTVALIKKETKPCPKCSINIHKIVGCSQMFCTNCNTKFNWSNIQIITRGAFHNPHYTEYKSRGGTSNIREAGDIVCGGVPYPPHRINGHVYTSQIELFQSISNAIQHTRTFTMARLPVEDNDGMREARIKFIMGTFDENRWKSEIFKIRKRCSYNQNLYQILDMFTNCSVYILRTIIDERGKISKNYTKEKNELDNLYKYAKEQVNNLAKIYNYTSNGIFTHEFNKWNHSL